MAETRVPDDANDDTTHDGGCGCCQAEASTPADEEVRRLEALTDDLDRRLSTFGGTP